MALRRRFTYLSAALSAAVIVSILVLGWAPSGGGASSRPATALDRCLQGELQVAIEQGGGNQAHYALGYTFLIVNTAKRACTLRGYPRQVELSNVGGNVVHVTLAHRPTSLYAQPKIASVFLGVGGVASFGISYSYTRDPFKSEAKGCLASLVDVRLPARASSLFSYEFPVNIDACAAGRVINVTPIENLGIPLA